MGSGANAALLCGSVYALQSAAKHLDRSQTLLCGESNRLKIPGHDFGNSPSSFTSPQVKDKTVLLYTTSGTRAIPWVKHAKYLCLGCFLNVSAVVSTIMEHDTLPVVIVCCGYNRCQERSLEDELCAAYVLHTLINSHENPARLLLDDTARLVMQQVRKVLFVKSGKVDRLLLPGHQHSGKREQDLLGRDKNYRTIRTLHVILCEFLPLQQYLRT